MQKRVQLVLQVNYLPARSAAFALASVIKTMICLLSRGTLLSFRGA